MIQVVIQVFEDGGVSQSSPAQPAGQALVVPFGHAPDLSFGIECSP